MTGWIKPTVILCIYGFLKSVKPSESFLNRYLTSPSKNFTNRVLDDQVYPVWTYSYLAVTIVVFLFTDLLRYKPIIIVEACAYIATWALLIWTKSLISMQFMEFTYGIGTACEIAYFSYIYAAVPEDKFKVVSGYVRGFLLAGHCLSGVIGQVLISTNAADYLTLNIISFADVIGALVIALFLPSVKYSTYFNLDQSHEVTINCDESDTMSKDSSRYFTESEDSYYSNTLIETPYTDDTIDVSSLVNSHILLDNVIGCPSNQTSDKYMPSSSGNSTRQSCDFCRTAFKNLARDFVQSYRNRALLIWSIWGALATCGELQVLNFAQNLWEEIDANRSHAHILNGAVDAASMFTGALGSFGISQIPANWDAYGELLLALASLCNGALLIVMARTSSVVIAYIFYGIIRVVYQTVVTIAMCQIAKNLEVQRYALIFGFNTFIALLLQAILTFIVADKAALDVGIRMQFVVYGGYFGVMGIVFLGSVFYNCCKYYRSSPEERTLLIDTETESN